MIRLIKNEKDYLYSCIGCMSMMNTYTVLMDAPFNNRTTQFVLCKDCLKRLGELARELDNNDRTS